jgi:opine dehydrogenase
MKISIIGAGNGGQAMAGHFAILGHKVTLYNRSRDRISNIINTASIELQDAICGIGKIDCITTDISKAVKAADLIMITTTADAHAEIACLMAPYVEEGQCIVLNPGRTLGAIEFSNLLRKKTTKCVYIAEAQSLIYACRAVKAGQVKVIGVKDKVLLAAYPAVDTDYVLHLINSVYPCFIKANNVLETSLENIGAIFHPSVVLFNAATIERGQEFYFYNDMTPAIADFLAKIDEERLKIGIAFGIKLNSVSEWVSFAYKDIKGDDLCTKMQNNPAYFKILSPPNLNTRLLYEDVPTGILPLSELGKMAGVETPLLTSVLNISQTLLNVDFVKTGRTLRNLGLANIFASDFLKSL